MRKNCSIQVTNWTCLNESIQARWQQNLNGGCMKIITNAKYPGSFTRIGEAGCRLTSFRISRPKCHPKIFLRNGKRLDAALFSRHQPFAGTAKPQLNSKGGGQEDVDFPRFNFLQIARGNFGAFGQFILRQLLAHTLAAHVRTEDLDSLPLFLRNGHDILHRFYAMNMNDTYIAKNFRMCLPLPTNSGAIGMSPCPVTKWLAKCFGLWKMNSRQRKHKQPDCLT